MTQTEKPKPVYRSPEPLAAEVWALHEGASVTIGGYGTATTKRPVLVPDSVAKELEATDERTGVADGGKAAPIKAPTIRVVRGEAAHYVSTADPVSGRATVARKRGGSTAEPGKEKSDG